MKKIFLCIFLIAAIMGGCSNAKDPEVKKPTEKAGSQQTKPAETKHYTIELEAEKMPRFAGTKEEMGLLRDAIKSRAEQLGFTNISLGEIEGQLLKVEFDAGEDMVAILTKPGVIRFETEDGKVVLTNKHVKEAVGYSDKQTEEGLLQLLFNPEGEQLFKDITQKNINKKLTIYLDDSVLMKAIISKPVTNGMVNLGGFKSGDDAREVGFIVKNVLPTSVKVVKSQVK